MKSIFLLTTIVISICFFSCSTSQKVVSKEVVKEIPPMRNEVAETKTSSTSAIDDLAQGKNIYSLKCTTCHKGKTITEYSDEKWVPIMNDMAKKARLTDTEKALVLNYVLESN